MGKIIKSNAFEALRQNQFSEICCRQDLIRVKRLKFVDLFVQRNHSFKITGYYTVTNMFFKHMNN